jgi:hypothetical protein
VRESGTGHEMRLHRAEIDTYHITVIAQ